MGNCCSGPGGGPSKQPSGAKNSFLSQKSLRVKHWQTTGAISLRDAHLKDIPLEVEAVAPSSKVIDVCNNRLSHLPAWLVVLPNLQRLVLSRNELASLPVQLGGLRSLRVLLLDGNRLTNVPESIGTLTRLETLSLAANELAELPLSLGMLRALKNLDVSSNHLSELPSSLSDCTALEELEANDNRIVHIPEALGNLQRLRKIGLDRNRIMAVPPAVLRGCAALQTLSLHDNPVTAQALEATEGFAAFEQRRQTKYSKSIASGVLLGSRGLEEAADRKISPRL